MALDHYSDYIRLLLPGPLKRRAAGKNHFAALAKVLGRLFDTCKQDIFRAHEETMLLTAGEAMLAEQGRDRSLPRLVGEEAEAYRYRLVLASNTAELGGTRAGILAAVTALGVQRHTISPYRTLDAARWAEFILWLPAADGRDAYDLPDIDAEVRRTKETGAKPNYGLAPPEAPLYCGAVIRAGLQIYVTL